MVICLHSLSSSLFLLQQCASDKRNALSFSRFSNLSGIIHIRILNERREERERDREHTTVVLCLCDGMYIKIRDELVYRRSKSAMNGEQISLSIHFWGRLYLCLE